MGADPGVALQRRQAAAGPLRQGGLRHADPRARHLRLRPRRSRGAEPASTRRRTSLAVSW
ncbi:hypothetical protein [Nocardioides sp. B-3]|uniref:hypothetical protein n=1 Tax=Nocardioides sp. B-3 TaxID=2895565 RepID=UPI002152CA6F|nr:hypothetical protein [Nocardioides sp. B-3]UUZ58430.1 hypothetical protein LP418_19895 [Nocardioides sp. B-3]